MAIQDLLAPWFDPSYNQTPELADYVVAHAIATPVLSRGIFWYEEQKADFEAAIATLLTEGWSVSEDVGPFAAFSEDQEVAKGFADQAVYGLVMVVSGLRGVSVLEMLEASGTAGVNVQHEKEWLVPAGQCVRFDSQKRMGDIQWLYGRVV